MSSKYDKTVQISHEEEGTYHRREYETSPKAKPGYTTHTSYEVVPAKSHHKSGRLSSHQQDPATAYTSDEDNFEEWTTSKRKVNHKTRQVETRVSRQLLVEDGKVIADSGPQVTTRIKEDNKVEECEKEKAPKNKGRFEALENAPESGECSGRVLGEKKEIQRVSREVREENMQYHDERFKELTGHDVHRRAIQAPHELITITDKNSHSAPRGKMVHYSNKGKKYQDTDEILEVAKLAIDGSITKEVKRTKHHEEFSDDEKPDEKGEAEALRHEPIVTRSSRRHVDYVNDFDDTSTPSCSEDEQDSKAVKRYHSPADKHRSAGARLHSASSPHRHRSSSGKGGAAAAEDEAFPRYEIDPLLNSLREEDFRPMGANDRHRTASGRYREHPLQRKDRTDSSDCEQPESRPAHHYRAVSPSSSYRATGGVVAPAVEIPEEYRVNKQRLLSGKGGNKSHGVASSRQRDRSFSPTNKSHLSQRSSKSHRAHREDASVQAHLTDEEEERKSMRSQSSSSVGRNHSHEKATKHLQRQSTANSSRNYYFGKSRPRSPSARSSSSSSLSDPKERLRKHGARSRDSGFRSPHGRTDTPTSMGSQQQIYSVSSKNKRTKERPNHPHQHDEHDRRTAASSPTPTTGSLGQRSVKTTTTTMSAGLADRPLSREERSAKDNTTMTRSSTKDKGRGVGGGRGGGAGGESGKVSKPPSPFQKFAQLFAPSSPRPKKPVASRA